MHKNRLFQKVSFFLSSVCLLESSETQKIRSIDVLKGGVVGVVGTENFLFQNQQLMTFTDESIDYCKYSSLFSRFKNCSFTRVQEGFVPKITSLILLSVYVRMLLFKLLPIKSKKKKVWDFSVCVCACVSICLDVIRKPK